MSANFAYVSAATPYSNSGGDTSIPLNSINATTGDLIIVALRWEGGGGSDATTATVTDDQSNAYSLLGYMVNASGEDEKVGIFYCLSATGSAALSITATLSVSRGYRRGLAASYSYDGTIQKGSTQTTGGSITGTTTWTSDAALTVLADDLIITAHGNYNTGNKVSATDYGTIRTSATLFSLVDYIPVSGGSYTMGGSMGNDSYVQVTGFFESTGGTPSIIPQIMYHRTQMGN